MDVTSHRNEHRRGWNEERNAEDVILKLREMELRTSRGVFKHDHIVHI